MDPPRSRPEVAAFVLSLAVFVAGLSWNLYTALFGMCSTTIPEGGQEATVTCGFAGLPRLVFGVFLVLPVAMGSAAMWNRERFMLWVSLFGYFVVSLWLFWSFPYHLVLGVPLLALAVGLHVWDRRRSVGAPPPGPAASRS